jgi:hypothetical protein
VLKGLFACVWEVIFISRQMFVWRMAQDHRTSDLCDNIPGNVDAFRVHREIKDTDQLHID